MVYGMQKYGRFLGVHSFFVVYIKQRYMEWCTFMLHKTNTEGIDEWNSYIQETEWQPVLEKEIILDFNGQFEMMAKEISIQIQQTRLRACFQISTVEDTIIIKMDSNIR